jgi:hypothetical protein
VSLNATVWSIGRVGMRSARDQHYCSGKRKRHGVNVQMIADPVGRLVWAPAATRGARHDLGAGEHGLIDARKATGYA